MTDASRSARLTQGEVTEHEKDNALTRNGNRDSSQAQPPQSASGDTSTPEADCDRIVVAIGQRYRTFGGGRDSDMNPIAHALRNEPLAFAAGVDVRAVVEFIQSELSASTPRPDLLKLHALSEQMYAKANGAQFDGPGWFYAARAFRECASMVLALETELLAVPQTQEPTP